MKMIKFSRYVVLGAALAVVTGCNDAKLSTIDNGVYIAEAAPSNTFSQQIEAQLVDEGDVIKTLTVRLVRAIDQDVTVWILISNSLMSIINSMKRLTNFCRKNSEVLNAQLRFPQVKCLHQSLILL